MRAAVINVFAKEKLWENAKLDMHIIIIIFIFFNVDVHRNLSVLK